MAGEVEPGTPRRTTSTTSVEALAKELAALRREVAELQRGTTLRNASIGGGEGLQVLDAEGNTLITLSTQNGGGVSAYDEAGQEVARFGPLNNSAPGQYGVEVLVDGAWLQLGRQNTSWSSIGDKPSTFPATTPVSDATHAGAADTAAEATHAADADGSAYAFNNNVGGTTFYAVWVGNDGGFHLGRNTSSKKYKTNIRNYAIDPKGVLALQPVLFDRKPRIQSDGTEAPAAKNEYGLIAEDVAKVLPEIVTYFEGEIDGVRYDLLGLAIVDVIKQLAGDLTGVRAALKQKGILP